MKQASQSSRLGQLLWPLALLACLGPTGTSFGQTACEIDYLVRCAGVTAKDKAYAACVAERARAEHQIRTFDAEVDAFNIKCANVTPSHYDYARCLTDRVELEARRMKMERELFCPR